MSHHEMPERVDRRGFLELGAALLAGGLVGCAASRSSQDEGVRVRGRKSTAEENLAVWNQKKGVPYVEGSIPMPGVCQLPGPYKKTKFPDPDKYKDVERVQSLCQLCSTICGITGYVKDGRVIKIDGNPQDPNSRGKLCARGQAALNHQYHPERLLYPIRRVGARGEGKWKRITWDEALDEIATRLKAVRASGKPEEFAFHQGRNRSKDAVANFLAAFGTNTQLNHRGLCSAARRAANLTYLFESDWDLGDYEHTRYILNFGSNMFEAHQGHVPGAQRIQRGRFENGAKLVTFDVRMSNTAGNSDEFHMPRPGTDGAIALAMAHVIVNEGRYDTAFTKAWMNVTIDELRDHLAPYTPQWAEETSTVRADVIARIAREFAAAAPRATTMCNRGSSAHVNGYHNDRAIGLLNVLVGSVAKPGGWCWMYTGGFDSRVAKPPSVPKPKTPSLLADPPEFVLANRWNTMRVGEIVYWYLQQERARIQVYMTYNLDSPLTWPEQHVTRNVLLDEDKIGFHVCINPFYNETASYADMVLPWATFLERWDVDARGAYNLKPYVSMRRPMVESLGEARDIREFFPELARRIGADMAQYYPEGQTVEDVMAETVKNVPFDESKYASPMEYFAEVGAFEDPELQPYYEPYLRPLTPEELEGSATDEATGIITKDGKGIGILQDGVAVLGFKTPSRKLEVRSTFVAKVARNEDVSDLVALANSKGKNRPAHHRGHEYQDVPEWPTYVPIDEHEHLEPDQLVMTSFKWNVHNHGRTANLKWLSEIVHSNPAWIHPNTAKRLGLQNGDWVELTGYRSKAVDRAMPGLKLGAGEIENKLRLPVVVTLGVHEGAIAISNSLGHTEYSKVAQARRGSVSGQSAAMDLEGLRDADWERNLWWEDESRNDPKRWKRNTGNGWAQNAVLPISPDYISGQQAFNDTVVRVRKIT